MSLSTIVEFLSDIRPTSIGREFHFVWRLLPFCPMTILLCSTFGVALSNDSSIPFVNSFVSFDVRCCSIWHSSPFYPTFITVPFDDNSILIDNNSVPFDDNFVMFDSVTIPFNFVTVPFDSVTVLFNVRRYSVQRLAPCPIIQTRCCVRTL